MRINEEEHPYFQIIETELQRIDDLLLDLLNISKPKTDELCMVDLKQLVEKTIELMQPKAIISNAMIVFDYEETFSYSIYGSYNRLKQMLINLLKNAIESIETSNFIFVSLHYKNDSIQLSIKDRGKGMDTTTLETIFNPFYTTKETGTGLGLILVQSVVAEHNGTIQIESEQGVGTTFLIDFKVMPNDIQKRSQIQYSNELYSKLS